MPDGNTTPERSAVYVDDARILWHGMRMSHLWADDVEALHAFAKSIGLRRVWFQDKSLPHYDVSDSKRDQAILAGAIPLDSEAATTHRRVLRARLRNA